MTYIWDQPTWPDFRWDASALLAPLSSCRRRQGVVLGRLKALGLSGSPPSDQTLSEAQGLVLVEEALTTALIEGEQLDREQVRSSVARRLGLPYGGLRPAPRSVDGLVQVLLDATTGHDRPLTGDRLWGWQAALFPTGYSGLRRIRVGAWRETPMEVVSGREGRPRVHYQAPPPERVPAEMDRFLAWWAAPPAGLDGLLRAAIAHLWFLSIHPFEDGNGRIARALADMALAQDERSSLRYYSLSMEIMAEREAYYAHLEHTQRGDGEITKWLLWFIGGTERAVGRSEEVLERVLAKAAFWQRWAMADLNERQRKALNWLLDKGEELQGGLTNRKYAGLNHCSPATAQRDLGELARLGVVWPKGQGRARSYEIDLIKIIGPPLPGGPVV